MRLKKDKMTNNSMKINNDLSMLDLKGEVKCLTETTYNVVDKIGEIQSQDVQSKITTLFNEKGNKIERKYYWAYNNKEYKYTYEYDDKGYLIEEIYYQIFKSFTRFISKSIYKYDKKGNMIEFRKHQSGGWTDKVYTGDLYGEINIYHYNKKGKIILEESVDWNIEIGFIGYYTEKRGVERIKNTNEIYKFYLFKKYSYQYDDKGNKKEVFEYNTGGFLIGKQIFKYDDKGNMIEHETYIVKGSPMRLNGKSIFKYDEKGNVIEANYYCSDGSLFLKNTFKCDESGNDYDEIGNWIKKTIFNNGTLSIIEREITYY